MHLARVMVPQELAWEFADRMANASAWETAFARSLSCTNSNIFQEDIKLNVSKLLLGWESSFNGKIA